MSPLVMSYGQERDDDGGLVWASSTGMDVESWDLEHQVSLLRLDRGEKWDNAKQQSIIIP